MSNELPENSGAAEGQSRLPAPLWYVVSLLGIVGTIALCAWVGRPSPLVVEIPDVEGSEDLSIPRIQRHMEVMTSEPSRLTGYSGVEKTLEHLRSELEGMGAEAMEVQEFSTTAPVVEEAWLEANTPEGVVKLPIHPLWPNLVRTSHLPEGGVSGPLLDCGKGVDSDLKGKAIPDSIVVLDWNSGAEWLSIQEFGGKALLYRANEAGMGSLARKKFLTVPANFPRFYVAEPDLAQLDSLMAIPGLQVTLRCRVDWAPLTGKNLLAKVVSGDPPEGASASDTSPVIFHAYYDSISTVPSLAPGAEQACGPATLLEVARYFRNLPDAPPRSIYVLFAGGHGQALKGITHFTRQLYDGLEHGWKGDAADSLLAKMGRPGIMTGLDLSSRSDRIGLFCTGSFRSHMEHLIRPKFKPLGLELTDFANSYLPNPEEVTVHTITPFVDCINLKLGRGWWTYFPYQAAFASEMPLAAGIPAVTLSTINDDRRYVDTPDDTMEHIAWDLFERQIAHVPGERVGLARLALAFAYWKGPFTTSTIESKLSRVEGRVVWLDQERDYTPNRPLRGAAVAMKTFWGSKFLMGTRGVPVTLSGDNGEFVFDGLLDITGSPQFYNVRVEAYGLSTERFLQANENARDEYLLVLEKGGRDLDRIPRDGGIVYAVDWARPDEHPSSTRLVKEVQYLNPVTFPCKPITLYGLTEPRGFISLMDMQLLDVATESPPYQWGQSFTDSYWGDPEENCLSVWADPTLRVRLTLGLGFQEKRLILINNTPEDPVGQGFVLSELETIPSWVLQGAENMWHLNQDRVEKFEAQGINNPRVRDIHNESRQYLDKARAALAEHDYMGYRRTAEIGWALESRAYSELLGMANNMIKGVLFYLLLLIPFSYCMERLVFASGTIKGRIIGVLVVFTASFVVLALIHPAFRFTLTPVLVLLAFVILALAVSVSFLLIGKFDGILLERKLALTGRHEDTVAAGNVAMRALDLGIANIRRRPQRAVLTGLTIVLVTFTLLSFTSIVPEVSISRLNHAEGEPVYHGLLARTRTWVPMPNPLYDSLRRNFVEGTEDIVAMDNVLAGRAWYFSDQVGNLSRIDLAPGPSMFEHGVEEVDGISRNTYFSVVALTGMEPNEAKVTAVEDTLVAGCWFQDPDEASIILPEHVAEQLGYGTDDIGKPILVFGQEVPLVGIVDEEKFDALRDVDGEPLTPVNFAQTMLDDAAASEAEEIETLKEYVHWPTNQIAFMPFEFTRRLGGTIRSIAIATGEGVSPHEQAAIWARRSNLTILASDLESVTLYASLERSRLTGAGQILIPLLLGFIMVLGTMLGSVYERRREIFVYNSVGLSPTNVASLFLAEAAVYAIIGASSGYLLGQVISKVLLATGLLSGLTLNYSAGSTVFVTLLTMAMVLVSTIYPARQAFRAAIPEQRKHFDDIEDDDASGGDRISIFLPFVATPAHVYAMQAYMEEFLDSVQGVSVGQLTVDDLEAGVEQSEDGRDVPVLAFRAWLAPFDLGISHDAELSVRFREDRGVYQYHLSAIRQSGDQQNWRRLTPWFILAIRKQLLMWRILTPEDHERYAEKAGALFGKTTA